MILIQHLETPIEINNSHLVLVRDKCKKLLIYEHPVYSDHVGPSHIFENLRYHIDVDFGFHHYGL